MKIQQILKDSNYKLAQFDITYVNQLEQRIIEKESKGKLSYKVNCLVRCKEINLTPEEIVRQLYLQILLQAFAYPASRIQVEYAVSFGTEKKRADIVIMDKDRPDVPYIIVELKKPKLKEGKEQLKSYCNATGAPMGVWTNGESISYYHRKDPNYFEDIPHIPRASERLTDVLSERWTIDDLVKNDKLLDERKSLKDLILEMEDEVLANAGVDVFEEMFKLIFAKLYDEMEGGRDKKRHLVFKNYGETETELKTKMQALFDKAREKWEGVFSVDAKLQLTPSHLAVCVASLEKVKLFNSNLDVVDEAFEYLINKTSKGEKGQYFTPRYVIDMCVKMLNPQEDETLIDTAAGSCGFPVHAIFHVWKQILVELGIPQSHLFTLEKKPPRCEDYVREKVFAIDFDEKAVRVGRTLNLIAGDGQTNVLHLNTLDFERWDEKTEDEEWRDIYGEGWKRLRKLRESKDNERFNFDILMANPPFAGDIKETRMLAKYDLSVKADGKRQTALGRDILFIERNLDFLKAGGRMAVVLPQGRFNNSSDKLIREFIAERCRILAVVGLHGNVFKPHTGTKTSVLFLQKWTDDKGICPKREDYPIFFATMQAQSKDNSGDKVYVKQVDGTPLLDAHGHLIVEHDLFNHEGLTQDGIAEAFVEFAKKENLSFFKSSPFDEVKYRALLEGLEISEVMLSGLNDEIRFDSEFFKKENLFLLKTIKNKSHKFIGDFSYVTDGIHTSIDYCEESNINLISATSPKENTFDLSRQVFISIEAHLKNPRTALKKGDVIISTVGTIGNCAVVDESILPANSDRHVGIIRIEKDFSPYFLSTFLLSKFGRFQTLRESTGNVQLNLFLYKIRTLIVPKLTDYFQLKIEETVKLAHSKLEASKTAYTTAENLLLETLGLKDFQPTQQNINIKSFKDSFLNSGRLDAEYYQPKYEEIEGRIKSYEFGFCMLRDLTVSYSTGFPFDSSSYADNGYDLIRINNIKKGSLQLDNAVKVSFADVQKSIKDIVKENDILISMSGTIGNSCKVSYAINAIINQRILKITPKNYNFDVLPLLINSVIGQTQLERVGTGGVQINLSTNDILNILIPIIPPETQTQIAAQIQTSFTLREQSQKLLERAKQAVEIAIEQDEQSAIAFLETTQDETIRTILT